MELPEGIDEPEIYRRMWLARRFDERVVEMRTSGQLEGVVHPAIGQEAVAIGTCAHLRLGDRMTSTHRGHAHLIAKGADPSRMMAELFGRKDGYCRGVGGSMHIADFDIGAIGANGIVGAGLPIAVGAALAAQLDGDDAVVVCFFSDGAVGGGPFHENLNIASLWDLPIVFLCENNGWASATPVSAVQTFRTVHDFGEGYGIAHDIVDGNDIGAMLDAARKAISHARAGRGPFLLEAQTFRLSRHAFRLVGTPEVRDAEVLDHWRQRDPIALHAASMLERGVIDAVGIEVIHRSVEDNLDRAVQFAEASPFLKPEELLEGLFAK